MGQFSASSNLLGRVTHSLGPLLYWLLAVPARFPGFDALALTMSAVNGAAVVGVVWLARRRRGDAFMFVVAVAVALMCRSLVAETYHDIWNPAAGVLPLTLLIFVCWSIACGEYRLLPLGVLVASFTAQCQLTFVLPSLGLLAVGLVGLAASRGWSPREGSAARRDERTNRDDERRALVRWCIAALVIALICWSGPLADQLVHRPGNFARVAQAATAHEPTMGANADWRAVVRAAGIPPWWLRVPTNPFDRLVDIRSAPSALSVASCAVVLLALLLATFLGLKRGRRDVATGAGIGLVLCAALAAVTASTPTRHSLVTSLGYTLWWGAPAGMWIWLMLALSLGTLLRRGWRPAAVRARAFQCAIGLGAVVAVGGAVATAERPDQDRPEYQPIRTVVAQLATGLPKRDHTIRVAGSHTFTAFDFKSAVIYALRRRDLRVVAPAEARRLGVSYEGQSRYDGTVYVWDGREPPGRGRVIARVGPSGPIKNTITVIFSPNRQG